MARAKKTAGVRHLGTIYVWDYPDGDKKSYGGWHLTADAAGLTTLIGGINELAAASDSDERAYSAAVPPADTLRHVHQKRHSGSPPDDCHAPRQIVLRTTTGGKPWKIRETGDRVEFAFDRVLIPMIRRQLERIAEGADDLGFGGARGYEGWRQRLSLWRKPA